MTPLAEKSVAPNERRPLARGISHDPGSAPQSIDNGSAHTTQSDPDRVCQDIGATGIPTRDKSLNEFKSAAENKKTEGRDVPRVNE